MISHTEIGSSRRIVPEKKIFDNNLFIHTGTVGEISI